MEQRATAVIGSPLTMEGRVVHPVRLAGSFDPGSADEVSAIVSPLLPTVQPNAAVVVDCSQLTFVNSKTIGMLLTWHLTLQSKGASFVLVAVQPQVFDVLGTTGVLQVIPSAATLPEALALLPPIA